MRKLLLSILCLVVALTLMLLNSNKVSAKVDRDFHLENATIAKSNRGGNLATMDCIAASSLSSVNPATEAYTAENPGWGFVKLSGFSLSKARK